VVQEGGACLLDSQCLEPLQFCNRENPLNMHCQFVVRFCFVEFFGGLECVGHFFADVAHFVFLRSAYFPKNKKISPFFIPV
jgi:hypothetical protein